MAALRWGLCGCGIISSDFKIALDLLPEDARHKHKVVAVAARSQERAKEFAQARGIEKHYGSYDDLIADKDVNVVYIGTVNSTHYEIGMKAIRAKKHVLIEKAMTLKYEHTRELYRIAAEQGVFVLDGMWTRFFPAALKLVELVRSGAIGDVKYVQADLCVAPSDPSKWNLDRLFEPSLGGGSLMDVGVYPLYFASMVFGGEKPEVVKAAGQLSDKGVDQSLAVTLKYRGGGLAQIVGGFGFDSPKETVILGTKGSLRIPCPFNCPSRIVTEDSELTFPGVEVPAKIHAELNHKNSWGLMYEAEEVRRCIGAGEKESPHMTWMESLMLSEVMEDIKEQVGIKYP